MLIPMDDLFVVEGELLTPYESLPNGAVLVSGGDIKYVGPREAAPAAPGRSVRTAGSLVCPGFIDLQVNGGGGVLLTEEPTVQAAHRITAAHARFGTTAMLLTIVTAAEDRMCQALEAVADAAALPPVGARILGSHIEGPFISPMRRGAHDKRFIRPSDIGLFQRLLQASRGTLRLVTLAPELPGALDLISAANDAGVTVSIGHSDATYEETASAIDAGARVSTHLFNAMRSLRQRDPGIVGAVLQDPNVVASVIADGVHVHEALLQLVARAKGADRMALVTDAMPPSGATEQQFELQGRAIHVQDGACYLDDGTLAGSALTMDRAVRTMVQRASVSPQHAITMATATPARVLGMQRNIGQLRPGARADIVVLDRDLQVQHVFVGGEPVADGALR
jgi:N-acetylglucosamine-6-phosphate deacetylase